ELERPAIQRDLVFADSRPGPGRAGRDALQGFYIEEKNLPIDRHRVLHAHHELHVQRAFDLALALQGRGLEDHRQVEGFHLRLDAVLQHLGGEPVDEIGRVLVHARREVHRAGGERGHVGLEGEHAAALAPGAGAPAGRQLRDDAGLRHVMQWHALSAHDSICGEERGVLSDFLQLVISGTAVGAIYALAALGFTLLWQASGTINFAQGEFVMVPAFITLLCLGYDMPLALAFALTCLVSMALLGVAFKQAVVEPLRRHGVIPLVIATLGLSIGLKNLVKAGYSAGPQPFPNIFPSALVTLGPVRVSAY